MFPVFLFLTTPTFHHMIIQEKNMQGVESPMVQKAVEILHHNIGRGHDLHIICGPNSKPDAFKVTHPGWHEAIQKGRAVAVAITYPGGSSKLPNNKDLQDAVESTLEDMLPDADSVVAGDDEDCKPTPLPVAFAIHETEFGFATILIRESMVTAPSEPKAQPKQKQNKSKQEPKVTDTFTVNNEETTDQSQSQE